MRVLVISATFPPMRSGGAAFTFGLCERLAERGLTVRVLTSRIACAWTSPHFEVFPSVARWSWEQLPRILLAVRAYRPDVLDLHFSGALYGRHPMITLAPGVLRNLFPRLRLVTHIEYPEPSRPSQGSRPSRMLRRGIAASLGSHRVDYGFGSILHDSDAIIVLGEDHIAMLAKRLPTVTKRCFIIPPPPTLPMHPPLDELARTRERSDLGIGPGDFVIAYFGLLYQGKGLETLLQGLRLLLAASRPVKLLVIGGVNEVLLPGDSGEGYLKTLRQQADSVGIGNAIHWTGRIRVDTNDASRLLRTADACVLPFDAGVKLHRSSFAVAAAHGLPTVTTRGEGTERVFGHGQNVLLCAPSDPAALRDRICDLMTDPELRRRLGEGALRLADEWFSWERTVSETLRVFAAETDTAV